MLRYMQSAANLYKIKPFPNENEPFDQVFVCSFIETKYITQ